MGHGSALLIGLDVGTTSCKAVVHDELGRPRAISQRPTPWKAVPTGAELDPATLASTCFDVLRDCAGALPDATVAAVGITSIAESGVVLAADGRPLAPMLVWDDTRGATEAAELHARLGVSYHGRTGLPLSHVQSISKYQWLRRNHADVARKGVRWLGVAEWLVYLLGGEQLGERSLASRTGWFDVSAAAPWSDALAAVDAPDDLLPPVAPAGTPAGRVNAEIPQLRGAALAVGGHDHLCAAVGAGAIRPGDLLNSCGTAQALIAPVPPRTDAATRARAVAEGLTVGWHAIPGCHAVVSAFAAGRLLLRVEGVVGAGMAAAGLDDAAMRAVAGTLVVEHTDPAQTTIMGIEDGATPGQVWRAALEAAEDRATELTDTVARFAGPSERTVAVGGWLRRRAFLAVKRARRAQVVVPNVAEAGARGAALLAGCAAGLFAGVDDLPPPPATGEGERQRAGGRGPQGEGERQRAGGRGPQGEGEREPVDHA